jgi:hypothetical protein
MAVVLVIISSAPLLAADQPNPRPVIPIYPGGQVSFDLSMTNRLLIMAIQAGSQAIRNKNQSNANSAKTDQVSNSAGAAEFLNDTTVSMLLNAIKDLKWISIVDYQIPSGTSGTTIANFYAGKFGTANGWSPLFVLDLQGVTLRAYSQPNFAAIFALVVYKSDAIVVRTQGKIDVASLEGLAMTVSQQMKKKNVPSAQASPATQTTTSPSASK